MKKFFCWLLMVCLAVSVSAASADYPFVIRNGSRDTPKIALTMDDCYEIDCMRRALELCDQYGISMTFFPLGTLILEKDADFWRELAASRNEIGSHGYTHLNLGKADAWSILWSLGKAQETLDHVLGYHYGVHTLRPPFGNINDADGKSTVCKNAITTFGFQHAVNWDVSQTDPKKAVKDVKNGSILLYHARPKDVKCIEQIIPKLLEKGFEFVTVSELLDFGEIQTSNELYVYSKDLYRQHK